MIVTDSWYQEQLKTIAERTRLGDENAEMRSWITALKAERDRLTIIADAIQAERDRLGSYNSHLIADREILFAENTKLRAALEDVLADIADYERVNNLSPSPGRKYCWDSVARARRALEGE